MWKFRGRRVIYKLFNCYKDTGLEDLFNKLGNALVTAK